MENMQKTALRVGKRAFILAFFILLALMILSGILTRVIHPGSYDRVVSNGIERVVAGSYHLQARSSYPIWRWFTAPFEVLFSPGNITAITIIVFLLFVGGAFTILERGGLLEALLTMIVRRFSARKYLVIPIIAFVFMVLASVLGVYESLVPLIILIVPLAHRLGWDSMTGLGMSLLPLAFGFSAAITNPFTIGVAQSIAGLPLFSGAWLRVIFFVVIYLLVVLFVLRHAKRVERDPKLSPVYVEDEPLRAHAGEVDKNVGASAMSVGVRRGILWFAVSVSVALIFTLVTSRSSSLSDIAFPLMALLFLVGGIGGGLFGGMGAKRVFSSLLSGSLNMLPAVLLILMALSVKHIVDSGHITDTILNRISASIASAPRFLAAFLVYIFTLVMNFFIGSASAKAFLMMPILAPLADLVGITRQTTVLAFDFGDGFSNMIFPTNALLIIALGLTVVSYPKWMRWTIGLQAVVFVVTLVFLLIAVAIRFGPF
ncbi:MAG TPA: Na+/H+ antiporter NhaC family protein [Spirochaetia bacterium]|nr:Na+/H+ antiporter NhaC family protein [Spirochaetia bacterium]